jgi:two-component system chemotaxis response regulator CheY
MTPSSVLQTSLAPRVGAEQRGGTASSLADATILLLDDDPTMRNAISATLRVAGCNNVLMTGNGAEALRMLTWNRVDLILCDCQMPAMDGMTFLKQLRASPQGAQTPVLMLTVSQNAKDAWEAQQLNVAGWLVKPVAPQSVVAQVAATLGRIPPRVKENLLAQLVATYEAELPEVAARLQAEAAAFSAESQDFDTRLDTLYRRMHQLKGQAGTMGYALLGRLAGLVHDAMLVGAENPAALGPHKAELVRLARVGTAGMKLVADRRLRGDGGAAGARMEQQIGEFATALLAKLEAPPAAPEGRRG